MPQNIPDGTYDTGEGKKKSKSHNETKEYKVNQTQVMGTTILLPRLFMITLETRFDIRAKRKSKKSSPPTEEEHYEKLERDYCCKEEEEEEDLYITKIVLVHKYVDRKQFKKRNHEKNLIVEIYKDEWGESGKPYALQRGYRDGHISTRTRNSRNQ